MSAQLPETRCKHLAQYLRPRATYIEQFCPSVTRISIRREDWNLLCKEVAAARAQGFIVDDTGVRYRRFVLSPTDLPLSDISE